MAMTKSQVNRAVDAVEQSGVSPLILYYQPVMDSSFDVVEAYRTQLRMNSLDLGVLTPDIYWPVLIRTPQGADIVGWALTEICTELDRFVKRGIMLKWASVFVPTSILMKGGLPAALREALHDKDEQVAKKLCIECSSDLLFEDRHEANLQLERLHEAGVLVILSGYGDEYCPTLRLEGLKVDMVMLSPYVAKELGNEEAELTAASVIEYAVKQEIAVIADGVTNEKQKESAAQYGCELVMGKAAGRFKKASSIRE